MHFQTSLSTVLGCMILASAVSAQFIDTLPACWQTCIKDRGPQCADTDLDCACHFASTPNLLPILISCVRHQCTDTSLAGYLVFPFGALQTACSETQYKISDDYVASVSAAAASAKAMATGTDTVTATATGLTRAHKIAAAATSSGGGAAAATTTPFVLAPPASWSQSASSEPVIILSATSPKPSGSMATSSTNSKKAGSTSNGGTVLDQAGTSSSSRKEFGSVLVLFSLGVSVLTGCMLL